MWMRALRSDVSVPVNRRPRVRGVRVHRRAGADDGSMREGIPVISVAQTLVDLATELDHDSLEAAINAADRASLTDPERLRRDFDDHGQQPGVAILKKLLDRHTFTLSDSALERRFRPIWKRAGLERPLTQEWVDGFKVDFYWPRLGIVVETDGLRFHRTPAQQAKDRRRDQIHTAAGHTPAALHPRPGRLRTALRPIDPHADGTSLRRLNDRMGRPRVQSTLSSRRRAPCRRVRGGGSCRRATWGSRRSSRRAGSSSAARPARRPSRRARRRRSRRPRGR